MGLNDSVKQTDLFKKLSSVYWLIKTVDLFKKWIELFNYSDWFVQKLELTDLMNRLICFANWIEQLSWTLICSRIRNQLTDSMNHWFGSHIGLSDSDEQSDLFKNQSSSHIDSLNQLTWFTNWFVQPRMHDLGGGHDDGFVQTPRITNCCPDLM